MLSKCLQIDFKLLIVEVSVHFSCVYEILTPASIRICFIYQRHSIICRGYLARRTQCALTASFNSLRNKCHSHWGRQLGGPKDREMKTVSAPLEARAEMGKVNRKRSKINKQETPKQTVRLPEERTQL